MKWVIQMAPQMNLLSWCPGEPGSTPMATGTEASVLPFRHLGVEAKSNQSSFPASADNNQTRLCVNLFIQKNL